MSQTDPQTIAETVAELLHWRKRESEAESRLRKARQRFAELRDAATSIGIDCDALFSGKYRSDPQED